MVPQNLRFRFTLVSYNILSQTLLHDHSHLYNNCNPRDLEWPKRGHKIVSELMNNQADIICLQEVESDHLSSLFRPKLACHGYDCLYKKKTGYKFDGCAIFYKTKLFHLLNYKGIEFNRTDVAYLLNRDNVGLIAVLKPRAQTRSESSHLIIANTHLIFNPKRSDIKLAQLKFFLSELEQVSLQSCTHYANGSSQACDLAKNVDRRCHHPTILCGDLNSTPDSEVSRYILKNTSGMASSGPKDEFISKRNSSEPNGSDDIADYISERHRCTPPLHTLKTLDRQRSTHSHKETLDVVMKGIHPSNEKVSSGAEPLGELEHNEPDYLRDYDHPMMFKSVYPSHNKSGQKYVSTLSSDIVDYIFYTPRLHLESYKELLTEEQLRDMGPLPNSDFPSDHITLGAKFVLN